MIVTTCEHCDSENIKKTKEGTHGQIIHCICNKCHREFDIVEDHVIIYVGGGITNKLTSKGFAEVIAKCGTLVRMETTDG